MHAHCQEVKQKHFHPSSMQGVVVDLAHLG